MYLHKHKEKSNKKLISDMDIYAWTNFILHAREVEWDFTSAPDWASKNMGSQDQHAHPLKNVLRITLNVFPLKVFFFNEAFVKPRKQIILDWNIFYKEKLSLIAKTTKHESSHLRRYDTKLLFSQKLAPYANIFFHLKSFIWRSPLAVKVRKKFIYQILSYISFCFEICAHLGHLFA